MLVTSSELHRSTFFSFFFLSNLHKETGIGKTVNGFRKHTEVGDFAKSIVLQWKKLVPEVIEK